MQNHLINMFIVITMTLQILLHRFSQWDKSHKKRWLSKVIVERTSDKKRVQLRQKRTSTRGRKLKWQSIELFFRPSVYPSVTCLLTTSKKSIKAITTIGIEMQISSRSDHRDHVLRQHWSKWMEIKVQCRVLLFHLFIHVKCSKDWFYKMSVGNI